ncbi:hypothetical protein RhiirA1_532425 [Rhizophagus irregularis]|uniref:Uncharacterized protein n=1 Tax=Rhizophagus irregularis TaxID=588596 RepID=A0A2N1NWS0_9GLOM|nr:hypothetical protein RhiirA1_532425 [Rhizophagus irregularis]PKK78347.1 hypothetical protein RhiirC2_843566 [Rhizophagus irregularis]CAB4380051.1 unnamed protein product [Rhizophagus irregularis]CAB4476443.1 unnamed protein product [Rhizophagus irregularis]CAB5380823.1 unnamed protein product [Rhizophagus irregularis]
MTDVRCHAKKICKSLPGMLATRSTAKTNNGRSTIPIDSATELPILQHLIHLQKNTMIVLANLILILQHLIYL